MIEQKKLFDMEYEESSIFKNKDVFNLNFIPKNYQYREKQLNRMLYYSLKIKKNIAPSNMQLIGKNATGKTTTLKKYFEIINKNYDNVKTVYINCQIYRTEYIIFSKIYKELFGKEVNLKGLSTFNIYDEVIKKIEKEDIILIVAFDDYGYINNSIELNKTMYELLRAHETFDNVKISVITITSEKKKNLFDLNVSTIYLPIEIKFPYYKYDEVFNILKQRCDLGFLPEVINNNTIEKIAKDTYWKGNIRFGIKRLMDVGEKAEINKVNKINLLF